MTYSSIARDYLLREGLPSDMIIKTGSPMLEVHTLSSKIDASDVLERLQLREIPILLLVPTGKKTLILLETLLN